MNFRLMVVMVFVCCILNISCVVALENSTVADKNLTAPDASALTPDVPDLVSNDTFYVNSNNVETYFPDFCLNKIYENSTLIISGDLEDIGVLKIDSDNVTISAGGAHLKNTAFDISGNDVTLRGIDMYLDTNFEETEGAAIYVASDNVNLIDVNIRYVVPYDVDAYAIFAEGNPRYPSRNLKIINSTVYFEAHNDEVKKYNCAVKLLNFHDSLIENSTIIGSFPLNEIGYDVDGAKLDTIYVYTLGIEGCDRFVIRGNQIISDVNKRPAYQYPTLDGVVLSRSNNVLMYGNTIYMTDFVTNPGIENYLYGINVHSLANLTIDSNNISMITTGGKLAMGTAYPIQINGPIMGVVVTNNDLYSFSNGPNIGIYSVNYFGKTSLLIANNTINVTGLAGVHEWALVTGIESQDSDAEIVNNRIEVHSVGEVNIGDNLYAISYRQTTPGTHTYNIQNNTAFTDGYAAVFLWGSYNSNISGNTLISFNENAQTGSDSYGRGPFSHVNDNAYDNRVINIRDYLATLNNVDGGNQDDGRPRGSSTSDVDGGSFNSKPTGQYESNPLIPGYFDTHGIGDNSGASNHAELNDGSAFQIGGGDDVGDFSSESKENNDVKIDGENLKQKMISTKNNGASVNSLNNESDATPDLIGNDAPVGASQASQADSSSVSKKAFEIDVPNNKAYLISPVFLVIITLFFLIIGYKRQDSRIE